MVTHCGWLWLYTTVSIGITITYFWKIFRYRVKRDHYEKSIGIRKFSGQIDIDCFDNPFSTDTNTGITQAGIPYLYKYPDQFYNVAICHIYHPLVMYKFFGSVNEVESHNKSSQSDLVLEKLLVTHCGWLWLYTTVSIGMTITYFWKIFHSDLS